MGQCLLPESLGTRDCMDIAQLPVGRQLCQTRKPWDVGQHSRFVLRACVVLPRGYTRMRVLHCTRNKGVGGWPACSLYVCMGWDVWGVVQRAWKRAVHGLCTLFACKPPQSVGSVRYVAART